MMSKTQWLVLLCLFIIYLLLGASLFYFIESEEEKQNNIRDKKEKEVIEELLIRHYKGDNASQASIFSKLTEYCGKPLNIDMSQIDNPQKWDFYHSFFFVITTVSTIGYGNLAPTTMFTRIFMIFYSLIGIPINGIVMVTLADFFGKSFTKLYDRWKKSRVQYDTAKLGLIGQIILYLVPGFTFFIFLPSVFMMMFEGWSYDIAVYYAFVTLTTIGLGDYVAGVTDVYNVGPVVYTIYQIFLLVWIIGGLGYIIMVLGFITRGMQSKKMIKFEQMITENIKKTPTKIRKELRALLHEFIFMPVKTVYKGDFEYIPTMLERSVSCPDLTIYRNMDSPTMARKRAFSDCYRHMILQRVQSDTDLQRIDKERTFQSTETKIQQNDLLLKVFDALSQSAEDSDPEDLGIHCFSDHEILASEHNNSNWSISTSSQNKNQRKTRRAISDIRPPSILYNSKRNNDTWYGTDASEAINEFKVRSRTFSEPPDALKQQSQSLIQKIKKKFMPKDDKIYDVEKQIPFEQYPAKTKRHSIFTTDKDSYIRQTMRGRPSVLSQQQEAVLEQTSVADFIRALKAITDETTENQTRKLSCVSSQNDNLSTTPQRSRRMPIRPIAQSRRSSLMPPTTFPRDDGRRFSLRPVNENLLMPPPPPYLAPPTTTSNIQQRRKFSVQQAGVQRYLSRRENKD